MAYLKYENRLEGSRRRGAYIGQRNPEPINLNPEPFPISP